MKKIMILIISITVVLSGCVTDNSVSPGSDATKNPLSSGMTESVSPDAADDPILAGLMAAVETVELNDARIDVNGSLFDDPESVRVTKELLRDIGNEILSGNPKRLQSPARGATNASQDIMVQFTFADNQYACI